MGKPAASTGSDELHEAARSGDLVKVISILSSNPLAVKSRDKHSRTPLHLAAWSGQLEVVNYLCKNKADVGACAMDDMGAIHFACQKGHVDVVKTLVSFGVSVKSYTRKGMTPLHFAAQGSHMELVKYLVRKGAKLNSRTKAGKTPFDVSKSDEIRSFLEESEKNPVKERADAEEEKKRKETEDGAEVKEADNEATEIAQADGGEHDGEGSKRKADEPVQESSSGSKKARVSLNHLLAADDDNQEDE
uniref:Uncharacterized protein n=1 Tax=Kalanchoe fedtschenkoi TaxID=63787 RepID=A0A7N0UG70_KALFE